MVWLEKGRGMRTGTILILKPNRYIVAGTGHLLVLYNVQPFKLMLLMSNLYLNLYII